ncbi:hypothetical protein KM043_007294 [Ampulex compressa]|nr:hypothetical protein KM043_007294 [Ampulex compressa]
MGQLLAAGMKGERPARASVEPRRALARAWLAVGSREKAGSRNGRIGVDRSARGSGRIPLIGRWPDFPRSSKSKSGEKMALAVGVPSGKEIVRQSHVAQLRKRRARQTRRMRASYLRGPGIERFEWTVRITGRKADRENREERDWMRGAFGT